MPQEKEAFELSAVVSLAENVRRQEKELRELRKQLEDSKDEKELKELRKQLEAASRAGQELDELKKQLEQAGKLEKEVQKLRAQLEEADGRVKELQEQKEEMDDAHDKDLQQAKGIVPDLAKVEAMAKKAREEATPITVTANDSSEVLALAVMGAAQNAEQLGDSLGKIERKLHEIIEKLETPSKKSG